MQPNHGLQKLDEPGEEALLEPALNALAKALKAMNFYPPEHPQRDESISSALAQLQPLLKERELILLWSRDACVVAERASLKSTSLTAKGLAREMLMRKLQRLIILPEISLKDIKAFLSLFAVDASEILSSGGIEKAMASAGITTIGANEVDLAILRNRDELIDEAGEDAGGDSSQEEIAEEGTEEEKPADEDAAEEEEAKDAMEIQFSMLGIDLLLGMLKAENRETPFLQLAREVIEAAEELKRQEAFAALLPAISVLLEIYLVEGRSAAQKEFIRYSLEQIANGTMTAYLLDRIEERAVENEVMLDSLCATIGKSLAYPLIQRLCVAKTLHTRKNIAIALTRSSEAAISALVSMLNDERWYVVRNMVTILGEIVSPDSLRALQQTASHPEAKVRKEVVKSLLRSASQGGENILVAMIGDPDKEVVRQVIFSLGAIRSKSAVRPLLDIVTASDPFLKELELKKLAVSALGKIGDRQVTEHLLDIMTMRGWLAPRRSVELKTVTAAALGQLGDENALPLLKKLARRDSPLGEACGDAADNLERVVK